MVINNNSLLFISKLNIPPSIKAAMVQMRMMMLFIVVLSCVMMKIVFCSALSHEVLNSQHYKHSQSTEACADDAKKWAGFTTALF